MIGFVTDVLLIATATVLATGLTAFTVIELREFLLRRRRGRR
jgi:hypothetical protein